jgi:hypothetical protein
MPSNSEVGHAKNVANFKTLITVSQGYGIKYNPSVTSLLVANLLVQHTNSDTIMDNVDTSSQAFHTAVGTRKAAFDGLKKLATRLVNAYNACDTTKEKKLNAKTINSKLQGTRAVKIKDLKVVKTADPSIIPPVLETPKTISASQQSYDQLIEHFSKLIVLLAADPLYNPNELDLKTAALNTKLTALKNANLNIGSTYTTVANIRIARDHALYDTKNGLCDTAQRVKDYVLSVYQAKAPEYKLINKIPFKGRKVN